MVCEDEDMNKYMPPELLGSRCKLLFRSCAEQFGLIKQRTRPIITKKCTDMTLFKPDYKKHGQ